MLFNSLEFLLFLPVVFVLYWLIPSQKTVYRQVVLLAAGYFFYGSWDYRFLCLLLFSTLLDFFTGIRIAVASTKAKRKYWLWLSIAINLGFLGIFKYYDFFASSFASLLTAAGFRADPFLLHIILPVGISFYTFHGLSYVLDIYYDRIKPTRHFISYAVFISFFPLLVAGPIERATHLLPQVEKERPFVYERMTDGLRQLLWGFFKKVVIADACAIYVNALFDSPHAFSGSNMAIGVLFFSIQIYCDFSGYTDIAIGTARLFGFEVVRNFAYPYFSRNIAEFWRRWHISLSSWFRDYVYIPLGGSRGSKQQAITNIFVIFLLSGLWHGANLTFLAWGFLHACYFIPLFVFKKNRLHLDIADEGRPWPSFKNLLRISGTFLLVSLAWIFFRAENLDKAMEVFSVIGSSSFFTMPDTALAPLSLIILIILFMCMEWAGRTQPYAIASVGYRWPRPARLSFYYLLLAMIIYFSGQQQQFIYFQF
jgi:alginate O-acetyltransferase complex protein AlgI